MRSFSINDTIKGDQPKAGKAAPDTSSETKKMMGFDNVSDVATAAPQRPGESATAKRGMRGRPSTSKSEETAKQEAKDKAVEEALSKIGTEAMKELAALPYDGWALLVSDPALRLTKDEQEKLANTYYLIAKSLKPEQLADWRVLFLLVLLQNGRIALGKAREHAARIEQQKKLLQNKLGAVDAPEVSVI